MVHSTLGVIEEGEEDTQKNILDLMKNLIFGEHPTLTWFNWWLKNFFVGLPIGKFQARPYKFALESLKESALHDIKRLKELDEQGIATLENYTEFRSELWLKYDCFFKKGDNEVYRVKTMDEIMDEMILPELRKNPTEHDTIRLILEPIILNFLQDNRKRRLSGRVAQRRRICDNESR